MSDWEASPSWVEPEDISSEQFTSKDGLTNEQLNKIVHNERYLKNIADNPFQNKGEWATATSYVKNAGQIDYVIYGNGLYFCKLSHTSSAEILPTNTTYWDAVITDCVFYRHRILLKSTSGNTQIFISITNQSSTVFDLTSLVTLLRNSLGYNDSTSFAEKIDCDGVVATITPTYFVPLCIGVNASTGNTLRVVYIDTNNVIASLPFIVNTVTDTVIAL